MGFIEKHDVSSNPQTYLLTNLDSRDPLITEYSYEKMSNSNSYCEWYLKTHI